VSRRYRDVEELTAAHELSQFDCGSDAQSAWLREHALQAHRSGTSRVYVVRKVADNHVVGFHALATGSVLPADAPERITRGTGRYDVPVIVLTRLGVDRSEQGQGLGRALVVHALRQVVNVADIVGVRALLIQAEDETARSFYDRLAEFEASPTDPLHLFLLLKDIRRTLA
jgi:GNAT superfamily N-acetyltransferase